MNKYIIIAVILPFISPFALTAQDTSDVALKERITKSINQKDGWTLSSDGKVSLRISPECDVIYCKDEISIIMEICNESNSDISVMHPYPFGLQLKNDKNEEIKEKQYVFPTQLAPRAVNFHKLMPGETYRWKRSGLGIISYPGSDKPGLYYVTYTLDLKNGEAAANLGIKNNWDGKIVSNTISILKVPEKTVIKSTKNVSFGEQWEPISMCSFCDGGKNLRWQLSMPENVSTFDSIWVESMLTNVSGRAITFDLKENGEKPLLVLIPHGKEPIVKPLDKNTGLADSIYHRKPTAAGTANVMHAFRADLRA
jgi:hypothetical protein